ncbi:hypothetical protein D3C78_1896970 [compost metagenome]
MLHKAEYSFREWLRLLNHTHMTGMLQFNLYRTIVDSSKGAFLWYNLIASA